MSLKMRHHFEKTSAYQKVEHEMRHFFLFYLSESKQCQDLFMHEVQSYFHENNVALKTSEMLLWFYWAASFISQNEWFLASGRIFIMMST